MSKLFQHGLILLFIAIIVSVSFFSNNTKKINGICFVAPPHQVTTTHLKPIKSIHANWIAITPYAFSRPNSPKVTFNHQKQWRGETENGTIETIKAAKKLGLKIMMKPHIWVMGQGWAGEYDLQSEEDWKNWESDYRKYILRFAKISDSLSVEMICIGTEYKKAVQKRPEFWIDLITDIRSFYDGQITYAANWDNFENVTFWDKLDYIGIDAYFPISKTETPEVSELSEKWQPVFGRLKDFSAQNKKSILFTEFGYRSMAYTAAGHWEMDNQNATVNLEGQQNALQALFNTFWRQNWFSGGFLWKWYSNHSQNGGNNDSHYTPQNKPAEQTVRHWYENQ